MRLSLFSLLLAATVLSATGQAPQQQPVNKSTENEVVRITTNLVQLDVVVTDGHGRHVTDLQADDFEVFEDKQARPITAFSYVPTEPPDASSGYGAKATGSVPPQPAVPLRSDQVMRTIVFLIDDFGIAEAGGIDLIKTGLKKFVAEQLRPGDLVAILRTSGGSGALQRMTSNREQLDASIDSIHWRLLKDGPISLSLFRSQSMNATVLSLENVVAALKDLPGRKNLVLFSGNFNTVQSPRFTNREKDLLGEAKGRNPDDDLVFSYSTIVQRIARASSQASVVIYGVDVRGLVHTGLTARDRVGPMTALKSGELLSTVLDSRGEEVLLTQQSLRELAETTGGFAVFNNNDLGEGISRIANDLKGYYLIGYRPDDKTFANADGRVPFHTVTIRSKKEGFRVRAREGFYGLPFENLAQKPKTIGEQLIAALESPFVAGEVRLRLTPLFTNSRVGSFVRTLVHIDARDLTFEPMPDGWYRMRFDVIASSYGENGLVADNLSRNESIRVRGPMYRTVLRYGLNYNVTMPIKRPGPYQLRAVIRDLQSGRTGSAYQFIEVPELKNKRLSLSGLAIRSRTLDLEGLSSTSEVYKGTAGNADLVQPTPAVRRFEAGSVLDYRYLIYNAKVDRDKLPDLQAEVRLIRDGEVIASQNEPPLELGSLQIDTMRLIAGGSIRLPEGLARGQYLLQILITDPRSRDEYKVAAQTIDFEIVK